MTLEQDLVTWFADRPDWQRDAVALFCANEVVTPDQISTIADHLIAGTYPVGSTITVEDIPGTSATGGPVTLKAISGVAGVNALLADQVLTFGPTGLTVIYGDNASGKSGYARLIREAVTARIKADLLGDVFAKEISRPTGSFLYAVADVESSWHLGDISAQDLSGIRFYDEECGDAYVTAASEVSYRPSALTVLDRLSAACEALQKELNRRVSENTNTRPDLPLVANGTSAKTFLDRLSADTTTTQIDDVTTLSADHDATLASKLQEEARLRGSDPNKEKARLTQLASHWRMVKSHVDSLSEALSADAIGRIRDEKRKAKDLRAAATIASAKTFDTEPLAGVGATAWRALWEAAREYSVVVAYHDHDFPKTDAAVCVLCQQPLSEEGAGRLMRFEEFVADTTSRDALAAENLLSSRRDNLSVLQSLPAAVTSALSQLQSGGENVDALEAWLTTATSEADALVEWIDGTKADRPAGIETPPDIGKRCAELITSSESIDASNFNESLTRLGREVTELQARSQLAAAHDSLTAEVARLKDRQKLEAAKRLTDTTGITRKSTDLTTEHVTSVIRDQFTRETERLHLRKVTIDPTGGRRNVTLEHRPKLLGATIAASIDGVLSEGEQTALGVAGFLTEVMFDDSKSAVVLDDPVSSLDAGRRSRVAGRLVELAKDRQVIVFTHEATFVTALNKAARDQGVDITERAIIRQGDRPGKTMDKHPWSIKDTAARIDHLAAELARLQRERDQLDSDDYTKRAQEWGGWLSQAWERAVNLDVVNELVDRGTNEVRPRMFRMLVGITEQDDSDFQAGYAKASEWALRHDQAPETNFMAPEPDELESELNRFKQWVARIKKYKK
ncbi:AAA family ATPase [Serinicoccus marinus]|uniref:AAA family ATPase n=1 Tax=Serinicoccus marinus TaxID=247333 RepID=UPI00249012B8|nr:AAA family ATPase [Serinicoccus marinus]